MVVQSITNQCGPSYCTLTYPRNTHSFLQATGRDQQKSNAMSRGFSSMTALLGLPAVAGYQNRDKAPEILGGIGQSTPANTGKVASAACSAS